MPDKIPFLRKETSTLFNEFINSEKAGGFILILVTAISLFLANISEGGSYLKVWNYSVGHHTIIQWINDGLMTIFFLLIGLELEREIYSDKLSNIKNALLPIFGALGGIGFTMSIFITLLAFEDIDIVNNSKIAIIAASLFSGIAGLIWLRLTLRQTTEINK